ncbi:hypothetical protein BGY98DRAFT_1104276 [Russula aff. rugulosa BPL654]|nr:hypothetical protein BGY98DRAFT_1104276 [Russula aff. rugulosa BPL654]
MTISISSSAFRVNRIGSPLRDTHLATTCDLWPAVTINVIVRGDFGGPWCLERNEIAEAYPEPDFITEFRSKLGQRRWIESGSNSVVHVLKEEFHEFDTYFQDAPMVGEQGDRVSSKLVL